MALDDRLLLVPGAEEEVAVSDVAQDPRGWIWITTSDGLFRLDGRRRRPWGPRILGDPIEIIEVDGERVTLLMNSRQVYVVGKERADELKGPGHPWTLEVVDDGRGRLAVSSRPGTGTGTEAMRTRAAEIGAKLEIFDREGGGTVVRLLFRP